MLLFLNVLYTATAFIKVLFKGHNISDKDWIAQLRRGCCLGSLEAPRQNKDNIEDLRNNTGNAHKKGFPELECFTGSMNETAESELKWNECKKNPGHENFTSAQTFIDTQLPKVHDTKDRNLLRSFIDLTVRLRVNYISKERPDDDELSEGRGSYKIHLGTGWIYHVYPPISNMLCPCVACAGRNCKKLWVFLVGTAQHVVYDTLEAKHTKVDFFFDDENSDCDGRMKCVNGTAAVGFLPYKDVSLMVCLTCDEDLGERVESAFQCISDYIDIDLSDLGLLP